MSSLEKYLKIFLSTFGFTLAVYYTMIVFNNLLAPNVNYEYIKNVANSQLLAIPGLNWRIIQNPIILHLFFYIIIACEILMSILFWSAFVHMIKHFKKDWKTVKRIIKYNLLSISIGIFVFFFAFIVIGGEFFLSFGNPIYNSISAGLKEITILLAYLFSFFPIFLSKK